MYAQYTYNNGANFGLIPKFTSTNAPIAISSEKLYSGSGVWYMFDRSNSTYYLSSDSTGWIKIDYGAGNSSTHRVYSITSAFDIPSRSPMNWTYQGSNVSSPNTTTDWVTLDTQTSQTGWGASEQRNYVIPVGNVASYRHYRLNVTASGNSPMCIQEWQAWNSLSEAPTVSTAILNDVVLLLSGETNVNNLSAYCTTPKSYILNSAINSTWTVHDASAGINAICMKAPYYDDSSKYVYVVISTNSVGYITTMLYETWDANSHVGTNSVAVSGSGASWNQQINANNGGILYISASPYHMHFYSFQSGVFGSTTYIGSSGVFQRTRRSSWDTVANGYPPVAFINFRLAFINTGYGPIHTRILNELGADVTNIAVPLVSSYGQSPTTLPATLLPDTNMQLAHNFYSFGATHPQYGFLGGDFSSLCDTYFTDSNTIGNLCDVVYNGNTYVVWTQSGEQRIAVRKG